MSITATAFATLIQVSVPPDIIPEKLKHPDDKTMQKIENAKQNAIADWIGSNDGLRKDCFTTVLHLKGKPVYPGEKTMKTSQKSAGPSGSITFVPNSGDWNEEEWTQIYNHLTHCYQDEHGNWYGAYYLARRYYGEPFFDITVTIYRSHSGGNSYDITDFQHGKIFLVYESSYQFYQQGTWYLDRMMLKAFRHGYYVPWDHFEEGMNSCVATMIENTLALSSNDEATSLFAWHGGPDAERYNHQLGAIVDGLPLHLVHDPEAISCGAFNFAGKAKIDLVYETGSSLMMWERTHAASMAWFKVYKADDWAGISPRFFIDFNLKLFAFGVFSGGFWFYVPAGDFSTYKTWAKDSIQNSTVEGIPKDSWYEYQKILNKPIKTSTGTHYFGLSDLTFSYIRNAETDASAWNLPVYCFKRYYDVSDIHFIYYNTDNNIQAYDVYQGNLPVHISYLASQNRNFDKTTDSEGWIDSFSYGGDIPSPSTSLAAFDLEVKDETNTLLNDFHGVSLSNETDYELIGSVVGDDPVTTVELENLDTAETWQANVVNTAFAFPNFTSAQSPNKGQGHYEITFDGVCPKRFFKDGGNFELGRIRLPYGWRNQIQNDINSKTLSFYLRPPAPNPLTHNTTLNLSLAQPGHARLLIYDISGRLVKVLLDGEYNAGAQTLSWDGTDSVGKPIANGVYTVLLSSQSGNLSKRLVVAR